MSLPGQGARVLAPWQAEDLALSRSTWNPALREAHPLVVLPAPRPLPSGLPPPGAPGLRPPGLAPLPHTGVSGPSASCFLHICLRCLDFRDPFLCASVPVFWGAHLCASAPVFWGSPLCLSPRILGVTSVPQPPYFGGHLCASVPVFWGSPLCLSPHILGTISLPQSPILWGSSCLRARLCSRLLAVLPSPCCLRSAWQPRTPQDSPPRHLHLRSLGTHFLPCPSSRPPSLPPGTFFGGPSFHCWGGGSVWPLGVLEGLPC